MRKTTRESSRVLKQTAWLALRDKKGKRLETVTSKLLFVNNGVVRAMYDNEPEVHEVYARDEWEKNQLCLRQCTTQDLIKLGLEEGVFDSKSSIIVCQKVIPIINLSGKINKVLC